MAAYTQLSQLLTAYPELAFFRTWQTTNNELLLRQQADLTVQEFELEAARKKYAGTHRLSWLDIRRAHCDSEAGRLRARYDDFQRDLRLFRKCTASARHMTDMIDMTKVRIFSKQFR